MGQDHLAVLYIHTPGGIPKHSIRAVIGMERLNFNSG